MSGARSGQGTNSVHLRAYNQRLILGLLRGRGTASKAELARAADLTNTGVAQIVRELQELGLVRVAGRREGMRGQPATELALDPTGAYGLGVRLDRRRIETVLIDLSGTVLQHRIHDGVLPQPRAAARRVAQDVQDLTAALDGAARRRVLGVGLARPDNLGAWLGKLDLEGSALPAWEGVDFAGMLRSAIDLPVFEENDGTAAAIAELFAGPGRLAQDFMSIFIGPATGGGVVLGGRYLRGPRGEAGDIGLMPVEHSRLSSAPPPTGRSEILLARASINALIRHLRHRGQTVRGYEDLASATAQAPAATQEWLDDAVDALVAPILSARALLDLETVVIDGDLEPALLARLISQLRCALAAAAPEARQPPALVAGAFGSRAAALGAASLPLFIHFGAHADILTRREEGPHTGRIGQLALQEGRPA